MNQKYLSISDILFEQNQTLGLEDLNKLKLCLQEGTTGFIVTEDFADVAHNAIQKMKGISNKAAVGAGSRIQTALQNRLGVGATGNAANKTPATNPLQAAGNYLNTRGAVVRNSPMIQTVDDQGIARYLVFPDLDLSRPGHKEVFQTVLSTEPNAKIVPVNDPARMAAAKSGKGVTEIRPVQSTANAKAKMQDAIANLNKVISNYNNQVNTYSFMSAEELSNLQKDIQQAIGTFNQTLPNPEQTQNAEAKEMAIEIDNVQAQAPEAAQQQVQPTETAQQVQQPEATPEAQSQPEMNVTTNPGTQASVQVAPNVQGATELTPTNVQSQEVSGFQPGPKGNVTVTPPFTNAGGTVQGPQTTAQGQAGKTTQPQYKLKIPNLGTTPVPKQDFIPKSGIGSK